MSTLIYCLLLRLLLRVGMSETFDHRQDRKYDMAIVNVEYNVAPFSGSERKKRRPVSSILSRPELLCP